MQPTSRRAARWMPAAAILAAMAAGCPGGGVSDTGYEGTWARGNDRIRSTLSIVREGETFRVRVGVRASNGSYSIRSGWDGRGEEVQDGAKTQDLAFRAFVEPVTGRLRLECSATPAIPSRKPLRYVDELVLEPGGRALSAYTVERNGERYEGGARPRRIFEKVSNDVEEPPEAEGAP